MSEKPRIKLFSLKRAILMIVLGVGVVSYRTYQSYQQKGHFDSVDLWAAALAMGMMFGILAFIRWWANRPE
jgi:hypothetical protein